MMNQFDLQGWAELEAAWQKAPETVRDELSRAMEESLVALQGSVQEFTPLGATEQLAPSIIAQPVETLADQVIGVVGTSFDYALAVELGTKPHFPPVEALEDWVEKRLGVRGKEIRNVAFLVARKIAAHGTPAFGMFHRGLAKERAQIAQLFEAARARIKARIALQGS